MVHKFDPARMGSLTSERRQQAVKPLDLLQRAGLQAGDRVLDLGCGAGFFTVPAARLVGPQGNVTAVDVQAAMVAATQDRTHQEGLSNVVVLAAGEYALPPGLPAFDWIILAYVLHEVAEPGRLLELALKALKPDGRLLLIEWPKEDGPHGPPAHERLAPEELAAFYQPLNLQEVNFWEGGPEYYALVLTRRDSL